jgi:hypothetical protein
MVNNPEFAFQPGLGEAEFATDLQHVEGKDGGGFFGRQTAEVAEFDEARFALVAFLEFAEGVVEPDHPRRAFDAGHFGIDVGVVEGDLEVGGALLHVAVAGVVDEDLAHDAGDELQEMSAILNGREVLFAKPQVSLVDERGSLQSMGGPFSAEAGIGEAAKFRVNDGKEPIEGLFVSGMGRVEKLRHIWRVRHRPASESSSNV